MHRDDGRRQPGERMQRAGNGIGNVVQLEIEKHRQAFAGDGRDPRRAIGAEEFQPELDPADVAADGADQRPGRSDVRRVDGNENRVGHHAPAGGTIVGCACDGSLLVPGSGSAMRPALAALRLKLAMAPR